MIFLETWSLSFSFVCNCFDDFCTNLPKNIGRFHRKQNPKFPKRRWVRSKNVFLSKSLLFSLVVTNESCFENFLRSLYLKQYVFFVRMQSHVSAGLVFDDYVWYFWSFLSRVWDVLGYRVLKKTAFGFLETWCPSFCIVCNCFDDFCTNLLKKIGRFHRKQNPKFPKRRWVRSKNVFLSKSLLFSLVVTNESCFENFLRSLYLEQYVFFVRMQSHVSAGLVFDDYVWYFWSFLSRVWDVLGYRILKKTAFDFLETWCPSFCIVCNCFDDFRTNLPKTFGRFHWKENTNFSKRRWVRSRFVCLSSALLFSLVVTKKYVLRTSWGISARSNTCFLFKCRVTLRLR